MVLGIGVALSAVSPIINFSQVSALFQCLLGAALTAIASLATRALEADDDKKRVRSLWMALSVALLIPVGSLAYHEWWDPSNRQQGSIQVIVIGNDLDAYRPYDEPGEPQSGYDYGPILGDSAVPVDCYVLIPDKGVWFHIESHGGWLPQDAIRPVPGVPFVLPRTCGT